MIKIDMEMPRDCLKCPFSVLGGFPYSLASGFYCWGCLAMDDDFLIEFSEFDPRESISEVYKNCPLIEDSEQEGE